MRIVADARGPSPLPNQAPHTFNFDHGVVRANTEQHSQRAPALVRRLGHLVPQTTSFRRTLDWYLEYLGLIVSDFHY